ncbi:MAG: hypothetical protein JO044_02880 [Mycobacteriaceae bacterium]|nr:hypothetical protein [Mycobacteriaceae bacterium]MBV9641597.1 hypothetical protein [Mycobacteriaceae bacterium]
MNDSTHDRTGGLARRDGPPLVGLAAIIVVLFVGGLAIGTALAGVPPFPFGSTPTIQDYFRAHPGAVQSAAVGISGSAVPLAIYAATANARLRQLGVTAPDATIALVGGVLSAAALGLAGLLIWTLSRPTVTVDAVLVRALYFLVYLTGGPAHVVGLGLLVAGIAVPSLRLGLLPQRVAGAGLVIAVVAELSALALIWPALSVLLPAGRVPALVWLVVAGALLPVRRRVHRDAV